MLDFFSAAPFPPRPSPSRWPDHPSLPFTHLSLAVLKDGGDAQVGERRRVGGGLLLLFVHREGGCWASEGITERGSAEPKDKHSESRNESRYESRHEHAWTGGAEAEPPLATRA